MEPTIIETRGGYRYIYSPRQNNFILVSSNISAMTVNENRDTSYLERKRIFLEENGFYDIEKPALEAEYDPLYIESNLANLRQLLIEVTDECNLACKYCGYGELYGNYDKRTGGKQNFKNVRLLINFLADLWHSHKNISFDNVVYIGFYGGEPLMNFSLIKQVIEYMDTIKIPGLSFEYNMTTNAMLLSRYMDYIVDKKFHLLISLDGSKENNGYRVTKSGKESFDRIYSNIKKLKENYHEYFDTYVEFNAVLHNRNSFVSAYASIYSNHMNHKMISGTCFPFSKKIFITAKGVIYPCERINYKYSLGFIDKERKNVHLDFKGVADLYNELYGKISKNCLRCFNNQLCRKCIFHIMDGNSDFVECDQFLSKKDFTCLMQDTINYFEKNPSEYVNIINAFYSII
jgi:radical SAM protein with 4Fe4S-binding SPASM domain